MSIFSKLFGGKNKEETGFQPKPPKFLRKERKGNSTYEIYRGKDPESAKAFLGMKRVDKNLYYLIVETPNGNWGLDIKGLFLERLLPWQKDIGSATVEGHTASMPDMFGLQMAAKGFNDNFVCKVGCGACRHEWVDALRYKNTTAVRCPQCKTLNKVDTGHIQVILV